MKREKIIEILKNTLQEYGIKKAYLFGSFARNEKKFNDIDVVIEPPNEFSLLDLAHVENELNDKTKKKFDLLTFRSISQYIKPYIEKDLVQII